MLPLLIFAGLAAGAKAIGGLVAADREAQAIREKAAYEAEQLELNAKLAELNASEVQYASGKVIGQVESYRRKLRAQQQSVLATTNLDSTFGSAAAIQMETETIANLDMITTQNNAWREAWGFRFEALQHRKSASLTLIDAEKRAEGTLLGAKINAVTGLLGFGAQALGSAGGDSSPNKPFTPMTTDQIRNMRRGSQAYFGFDRSNRVAG